MGSCVNALRVLTDLGLLEAASARGRDSARRVDDLDRLLDAYANAAGSLASDLRLEVGVSWRDLGSRGGWVTLIGSWGCGLTAWGIEHVEVPVGRAVG